ncbi:unnamed protein product [Vicia faba]|uniref:Uncharacterized protein n=1 Tax=Vicia faba TaxID=3906 RepID=A0AAV1B077_VICFA|nr:unnamed protein product [Vicia faba]
MPNFIPGGSGSRRSRVEREAKINAACSSLTPEEWQEKLNDACSSLIQIGFGPELFTVKNLHNFGYTEIDFLELIEPISSITNLDDLRHLFDTAGEALVLSSLIITPNEFLHFVNCMKWLNGELAKKNMADAVLEKKNPEKNKEMSKHDVVLALMLLDYAATGMKERKRIESEIDELKKRQNELETDSASSSADNVVSGMQERKRVKIDIDELKKRQKDLERESASITIDLKDKLGPIYDYEEPSLTELRTEAYKIYEIDCRFKGITPIPELDEMGYAMVEDFFGGIVKDRHFVKFLNDPVRKEKIENFFKEYAGGADDKKKGVAIEE